MKSKRLHAERAGLASLNNEEKEKLIEDFGKFLRVDLQLSKSTISDLKNALRHYLFDYLKEEPTVESVREFLGQFLDQQEKYMHYLRTLKRFYRDFLGRPALVASFKFPTRAFTPPYIPTREDLQRWHSWIYSNEVKNNEVYTIDPLRLDAFFLSLGSSGLRIGELRTVRLCDVDFATGKITPFHAHTRGNTKKSNFSFVNAEALIALRRYAKERGISDVETRLFQGNNSDWAKQFQIVSKASGIKITPKNLRSWFSSEMAELEVPDRYVDFLQGRTPRSVLARHYSDYTPQKVGRIYKKAGFTILGEREYEKEENESNLIEPFTQSQHSSRYSVDDSGLHHKRGLEDILP